MGGATAPPMTPDWATSIEVTYRHTVPIMMTQRLVYILLVLSGAVSLAYEVVWTRLLGGVFGVSVHATTAVLVAYMGGLSVGSYLGGTWATRVRTPLRVYALLEAAAAICALLVPLGFRLVDAAYGASYHLLLDRPIAGFVFRFAAALLVLALPTVLLGASLPMIVQARLRDGAPLGPGVARLYAANCAGAVLGVASAGLYGVPRLGNSATNLSAAGLGLVVAIAAWRLDARGQEPSRPIRVNSPQTPSVPPLGHAAMAVAGMSGFVALGFEIVWTHTLAMLGHDTSFAFACTLSAFLAGIAVGGWLVTQLMARVGAVTLLVGCQVGVASAGLLSFVYFRALNGSPGALPPSSVWRFLSLAAPMFAPALLFGATVPLCMTVAGPRSRAPGRTAGFILAANTLGAVLGCLVTGLCLVEWLGFGKTTVILATFALAAAQVALLARSNERPRPAQAALWSAIAALSCLVLPAASSGWFFPEGKLGRPILNLESASGMVEVFQSGQTRTLITDRSHRWGSNHPDMVRSMLRQGALPLLLHPAPRRVAEIGLATGVQSLPLLRDPRVEHLTIVEISPGMVEAARLFSRENGALLDDAKVRLVVDDGQSFLRRTSDRFDVVILGLFVPYRPRASALYSLELLQAVQQRLNPGGLLLEWLPLDQMPLAGVQSVLRTFRRSFEHVEVWEKGQYLAVLAGDSPPLLDPELLGQRLELLASRDVHPFRDAADVLASFALGADAVDRLAEGAPVNTEDRPVVEYLERAPPGDYTLAATNLQHLLQYREPPALAGNAGEPYRELLGQRFTARGHALRGATLQVQRQHRAAIAEFRNAVALDREEEIAQSELRRYQALLSSR